MRHLIYYEFRKNIFQIFTLVVLCGALLLNIAIIYRDYAHDPLSEVITRKTFPDIGNHWEFYRNLHERLSGPITTTNVEFILEERDRLSRITSDFTFSTEYDEDTETGFVWGDFQIVQHFTRRLEYSVRYASNMNRIVNQAQENINFYEQVGNQFQVNKNSFIANRYDGRDITVFYETDVWNLLFDYQMSDILILLLLLLSVLSIFHQEKETGMSDLILVSKKGANHLYMEKFLTISIYSLCLVVIFATVNFFTFRFLYGFSLTGAHMPIYAIPSYEYTPLNISVGFFYLLSYGLKWVGFLGFSIILAFISKRSPRLIFSYVISLLLLIIFIYMSGFIQAITPLYKGLAVLSPLTLLNANELYQTLTGVKIGDRFFLLGTITLHIHIISYLIIFVIIYVKCKSKAKKVNV